MNGLHLICASCMKAATDSAWEIKRAIPSIISLSLSLSLSQSFCAYMGRFGKMVACFRYASIDVHSVYLPPPKLDFNYQYQDWIQKEADEV